MELTESFEWEGRTIRWGRAGSGPDVVFCHGTPFSSRVWAPYADALSDRYTVHLWDMPGYGESSKRSDHPVDFGHQADAMSALLDHWGVSAPNVIAHDFGGAVALRTTLALGRHYQSLFLMNVVAIPPSGSSLFRFVGEHPDLLPGLPAYVHEAIVRAYITSGAAYRDMRPQDLNMLVKPWLGVEGQAAFYRQMADYDEAFLVENERRMPELACPTQVAWGAEDTWIPIAAGRRLAELVPGKQFVPIPGAAHLAQWDEPVAVTSLILNWLSSNVS